MAARQNLQDRKHPLQPGEDEVLAGELREWPPDEEVGIPQRVVRVSVVLHMRVLMTR